jgi:hypothetical protein
MRKWIGIACLAIVAIGIGGRTASAEDGCFISLRDCYYVAAREEHWGDRWLRGLDCELDFVECARRKLVGV